MAQQEAGSLATLVPRYLHAARQPAEPRYQHAALQALGEHHGRALITDPAWDAVTQRLLDAETAEWEPAQLLELAIAMRETASAGSTAEVLTWRIDTIVKTTPRKLAEASLYQARATLPPWLPVPLSVADRSPLARYMTEAATLISARTRDLAEAAVNDRPPWLAAIGEPPATLYQRQQWLRHVAIIAAYRDQHKITTTDPGQPLGPHIAPGRPDHTAYQHAARSADAARQLADLEPGKEREHHHRVPARTKLLAAGLSNPSRGRPSLTASQPGMPGHRPALPQPGQPASPTLLLRELAARSSCHPSICPCPVRICENFRRLFSRRPNSTCCRAARPHAPGMRPLRADPPRHPASARGKQPAT